MKVLLHILPIRLRLTIWLWRSYREGGHLRTIKGSTMALLIAEIVSEHNNHES